MAKIKIIKAPSLKERKIRSGIKEVKLKKSPAKELKSEKKAGPETLEKDIFKAEARHSETFEDFDEFSASPVMRPIGPQRPATSLENAAMAAPKPESDEEEESKGIKYGGKSAIKYSGREEEEDFKYGTGGAKYGDARKYEAPSMEREQSHMMPGAEPAMTGMKRQEDIETKYIAGRRLEEQQGLREQMEEAGKSEFEKHKEKYAKKLF